MTKNATSHYDSLRVRALRGRTASEAVAWLDERFTGSNRTSHRHQMDCSADEAHAEMRLRSDLVKAAA